MTSSLSRRKFLGAAAAAACATAEIVPALISPSRAGAQAAAASGKYSPLSLGLASYTFRNFTRAQLIGFMKQLHVASLNCKDVKDHLPMDPAQEAQAVADYFAAGITLHAVGAIYFRNDTADQIRAKFEYAKRAGVKVIVAGDPTPDTLPLIEPFVKEFDIRLAIHNHGPEDKLFPSPFDVLKVIRNMDPRIGCCIDIGHAARAGANLVEAIHACGPRLFNMHVKDLTNLSSKESQVPVGQGILPFREMFEALIKIEYQGFIDLEYEIYPDDPMPGVIESFAYMRGVLNGMGYLTHA
ncbi:MAG TPA: sugar phosphate isomerase/epimerase [Terracidiphilus sp.]|nr:sugar phosphate isomerase/epimerase [Terracidiphilus sp.]